MSRSSVCASSPVSNATPTRRRGLLCSWSPGLGFEHGPKGCGRRGGEGQYLPCPPLAAGQAYVLSLSLRA